MCETVNGLKSTDLNYYFKYIAPSQESDDFDVVTIDVSWASNVFKDNIDVGDGCLR